MGNTIDQPVTQTVPGEALTKLVCSRCSKPLSVFPIYTHILLGSSICGRCITPADVLDCNYIQNAIYEQLAAHSKFGCCHQPAKCSQLMLPAAVKEHEKYCRYRNYECPLGFNKCIWQGFYDQHLAHFKRCHPDSILNTRSIKVNFGNNSKENYLLTFGTEVFVVTVEVDWRMRQFECSVRYVGTNPEMTNYYYMVEFRGPDVNRRYRTFELISEKYEVREEIIRENLRDPQIIYFRIEVVSKIEDNETNIKSHIVKYEQVSYTCPVCLEEFIPFIFICRRGHSICSKCKVKVSCCPMCRSPYDDEARNYTLEEIVRAKSKPATELTSVEHQNECIRTKSYRCPLFDKRNYTSCVKYFNLNEMYDHVAQAHSDFLHEFSFQGQFRLTFQKIHVLKFESRLFRLVMAQKGVKTCFSLQLIGESEDCKQFRFQVEFCNRVGHRVRVEGPCVPIMDDVYSSFRNAEEYLSILSEYTFVSDDVSFVLSIFEV